MTLAPQELYSERADAYAKMGSLTFRLVDLREAHAMSYIGWVTLNRPLPGPVEQTKQFQKVKLEQLAEKARWLKACAAIRRIEESDGS